MEELNVIKSFKKASAGSGWLYDVKQNCRIGLSLLMYFGCFFTLLISFWMFKDDKYYSLVILGAMVFSLWGDYFISEELKEKNLFRYKTLLLIILLVISSFQIYVVNFLIAIALTLNIIIANYVFLIYSIIIKIDRVVNAGLLPNSFLVRGFIIMYEKVDGILYKLLKKCGLLLDYITVKGWFSNKEWYPKALEIVDTIKVNIFSEIAVDNTIKNDFLSSNVNVLNFSHYLLNIKDKKVRDAYLFFFRISSNPSCYILNSTIEYMSRVGNIRDIEVRDKACIFLDLLYKDIKKNKFFTRVSIWSYNAKELEEKYKEGGNEDIYAEMKEHWKILKSLEPNIFQYLIQNKLNVYPYLFLQDFILEPKELDYLEDYEQQQSKKLITIDKRMEDKNYKKRQDVLLRLSETMININANQYSKVIFKLYNTKPDMYQFFDRKSINNLHFGITNLFDEMISIDSKLVFEKDLVLFWKIADYEQWDLLSRWGFLEKVGSRYIPISITPFKENPLFTKVREAQWMDDNIVVNTKEEKQTIIKF